MPKRRLVAKQKTPVKEIDHEEDGKFGIEEASKSKRSKVSKNISKPGATSGDNGEKEKFTFFYSKESPFSQFHPCKFVIDGIAFSCAEQYMMHSKAVLFGDTTIAAEILQQTAPLKMKKLGRKVSNFDAGVWNKNCVAIVKKGNTAKFSQNPDLLKVLLATKGTTLVEASPRDTIWGIGFSSKNPNALTRSTWRGKNLLGGALTEVRDKLASIDV